MIDKGICTAQEIQLQIDERESRSPADGAKVVAHAWIDSEFKNLLLKEADVALSQLGTNCPILPLNWRWLKTHPTFTTW
ncbi:MAG: hypothetical protein CM1200mP35_08930 [Chloroflexota bacterium]|nr:MAG: hypothetical protein CM1200mP35_08930 [Chloroflexota bacterium]